MSTIKSASLMFFLICNFTGSMLLHAASTLDGKEAPSNYSYKDIVKSLTNRTLGEKVEAKDICINGEYIHNNFAYADALTIAESQDIMATQKWIDDHVHKYFDSSYLKAFDLKATGNENSLLIAALSNGPKTKLEYVKYLLDSGADSTNRNRGGVSPLMLAIFTGCPDEVIETLMTPRGEGINLEIYVGKHFYQLKSKVVLPNNGLALCPSSPMTPLKIALAYYHKNPEVVDELLEFDTFSDDAIFWAAQSGQYTTTRALLKWCNKYGISIDQFNEAGQTPLFLATQRGDLEIVKLFLDHGADPNAKLVYRTRKKNGPKHKGRKGKKKKKGAKRNEEITFSQTPLELAQERSLDDIVKLFQSQGDAISALEQEEAQKELIALAAAEKKAKKNKKKREQRRRAALKRKRAKACERMASLSDKLQAKRFFENLLHFRKSQTQALNVAEKEKKTDAVLKILTLGGQIDHRLKKDALAKLKEYAKDLAEREDSLLENEREEENLLQSFEQEDKTTVGICKTESIGRTDSLPQRFSHISVDLRQDSLRLSQDISTIKKIESLERYQWFTAIKPRLIAHLKDEPDGLDSIIFCSTLQKLEKIILDILPDIEDHSPHIKILERFGIILDNWRSLQLILKSNEDVIAAKEILVQAIQQNLNDSKSSNMESFHIVAKRIEDITTIKTNFLDVYLFLAKSKLSCSDWLQKIIDMETNRAPLSMSEKMYSEFSHELNEAIVKTLGNFLSGEDRPYIASRIIGTSVNFFSLHPKKGSVDLEIFNEHNLYHSTDTYIEMLEKLSVFDTSLSESKGEDFLPLSMRSDIDVQITCPSFLTAVTSILTHHKITKENQDMLFPGANISPTVFLMNKFFGTEVLSRQANFFKAFLKPLSDFNDKWSKVLGREIQLNLTKGIEEHKGVLTNSLGQVSLDEYEKLTPQRFNFIVPIQ